MGGKILEIILSSTTTSVWAKSKTEFNCSITLSGSFLLAHRFKINIYRNGHASTSLSVTLDKNLDMTYFNKIN